MNIKSRLKNLESKAGAGSSETCRCDETLKFDTEIRENGKPAADTPERMPDACRKCGKPVGMETIIVNIIDRANEVQS